MIYITGDCHGKFGRFNIENFPEQKGMTKSDYVIICGDFGGIWGPYLGKYWKSEQYWLDWLENKPFTTLFVDGNHENFDRLCGGEYPVRKWHGGKVHEIRPSVLHLMRGEVFEIDGKKFFAFGGASSHDIQDGILEMDEDGEWRKTAKKWDAKYRMYRIKGLTWWPEELPSQDELDNGTQNLEKHDWKVDFIVTHSPDASATAMLGKGLYKQDVLTLYLADIKSKLEYTKHFAGHMHVNGAINDKDILLYEQIIRIA